MSISFTDEFMVDTHQSGSLVSTFGDSSPRDQVNGAAALEEEAGLHPAACSAMRSENRMITGALGDMLCPHLPFLSLQLCALSLETSRMESSLHCLPLMAGWSSSGKVRCSLKANPSNSLSGIHWWPSKQILAEELRFKRLCVHG